MVETQLDGSAVINGRYMERYEIVCDMGEGFGKWKMGPDEEIMPLMDVANVACEFHPGDYNIMRKMVDLAKKYGVKVGSHPRLPDKLEFGRRKWDIPAEEVYNMVMYQTGALKAFLDAEGIALNHIKPHGELYLYVERDEEIMKAVLRAAKAFNVHVIGAKNLTYGLMANKERVDLIQEHYVDVDWDVSGRLVPVQQSRPKTPEIIYNDIKIAGTTDSTTTCEGKRIMLGFGKYPFMLCLHSDMPTSLKNIKQARRVLKK